MNKFALFSKAYELGRSHHRHGAGIHQCPKYANYPEGMAARLQDAWKNGWINAEGKIRGMEISEVWIDELTEKRVEQLRSDMEESLIAERRKADLADQMVEKSKGLRADMEWAMLLGVRGKDESDS